MCAKILKKYLQPPAISQDRRKIIGLLRLTVGNFFKQI